MRRVVLDIEADGLYNEKDPTKNATRLWCLCWYDIDTHESGSIIDYDEMYQFLGEVDTIIGHKIISYDILMLEKFLCISLSNKRKIDTLFIAYYLFPTRKKQGLDEWGQEVGIIKPPIEDWSNLPVETYVFRCKEDVRINTRIWNIFLSYLLAIYGDKESVDRFLNYLMFKADCAKEQEEVRWKIDIPQIHKNLAELEPLLAEKVDQLADVMPPSYKYANKIMPKIMYKKDGTLSEHGKHWFEFLEQQGLSKNTLGTIRYRVEKSKKKGNPGSTPQLKKWLFSLGWKPETFKDVREKGANKYNKPPRKVPQITLQGESDICPSVKKLYKKEPNLVLLEGMYRLKHRIGLLNSFLENAFPDEFVQATVAGLTNTLRFKHSKPCVNLPTLLKPYGKHVREVLIAPSDDHILCGADVSGLEESTKHHYMSYYDPEYVKEMRQFGFDAHLDIAVLAGLMTQEEANWYKWVKADDEDKNHFWQFVVDNLRGLEGDDFKKLKGRLAKVRDTSKKANFAAVYGSGAAKIADTARITLSEAKKLHTIYWKRNWAVKKIADAVTTKTINGQMWLYNPVSRFWYSLRYDKDRFSTLNQGTGVYCFDTWVMYVRSSGIKLCGQFHDEIIFPILKGEEEKSKQILNNSMAKANEVLKLNVQLKNSIEFGRSYADIH